MLLQALCEGGWTQESEEKDTKADEDEDTGSENSLIRNILDKQKVSISKFNFTQV